MSKTGTVYAVINTGILLLLIVQDLWILEMTEFVWYKVPVIFLMVVYLLIRFGSRDASPRVLDTLHFINLLAISVLVNAISLVVHISVTHQSAQFQMESPSVTAVVLVMFVNYAFSDTHRRTFFLHTAVPCFLSAIWIMVVHDHSVADMMDYTFAGIAAISLTGLAWHAEREARKLRALRRQAQENESARLRSIQEIRKLSTAVEHSPSSIVITDAQGRIEYVNRRFTEITGYTLDEVRGENPRVLKSEQQPSEFYRELWQTISTGKTWHGEFCNITKSRRVYWEAASIAPIFDDTDTITSYVAVKEDITEKRSREQKIRRMALQDALTGLANRAQFTEAVGASIASAERSQSKLAVLYLDLNRFKPINDTYGHEAGDTVLKTVGERISAGIRPEDLAGRFGGDEFVLLLRNFQNPDLLTQIATRVHNSIRKPIKIGEDEVSVGAGIGIAIYPQDGKCFEDLLRNADQAMYRAKTATDLGIRFASKYLQEC